MPIKVGIVTTLLSHRNPRGVARIAHAFVDRAVTDARFECLALDDPQIVGDRPAFRSEPLARFRERVRAEQADDRRTGRRAAAVRWAALRRWLRAAVAHRLDGWRHWAKVRRDFYAVHGRGAVWARGSVSADVRAAAGYVLAAAIARLIDLDAAAVPRAILDDFDVVVAHFPFEPFWELPIETAVRPFVVGWFHDAIPLRLAFDRHADERAFFEVFMRVVPLMVMRSNAILCISGSAMDDLHGYFPAGRSKSRLVHIGHDYRPADEAAVRAAVARCGLDRGRPIVVLVGATERRKNMDAICRVIERVGRLDLRPAPQFVLCGDDGQRPRFAAGLARAAAAATVVELGYVDDATRNALLSVATVFLYPSLWEGFGIPIVEAYAAGCLVVTSEISSMPEIGGEAALYCDPHDVESITAQVVRALTMSAQERAARVALGRDIAARFSWDRMYDEVCRVILERRPAGADGPDRVAPA